MSETAKRAFVAAVVVVAVVATALALWKLKVLISLAVPRHRHLGGDAPGVEWLAERRVPRGAGIALHYLACSRSRACALARRPARARPGAGGPRRRQDPTSPGDLEPRRTTRPAVKHQALVWLRAGSRSLPSAGQALTIGALAMEVVVGIFFTFAVAAYWIFERERAIDVVASLVAAPATQDAADTWHLIDLKLGAYVRGQGLLIVDRRARPARSVLGGRRAVLAPDRRRSPASSRSSRCGADAAGALAVGAGLTVSARRPP